MGMVMVKVVPSPGVRVEGEFAAMLVFNDVACDGHAQSGALADGLGGEEVLEEPLLHLVGHALAVVGNGDG